MADPTSLTRAARERLARREAARLRDIEAAWRRIEANVAEEALKLAEAAEAARGQGEVVGETWLIRQRRYEQLLVEIEARIGELTRGAPVAGLQRDAIEDARHTVEEAVQAALSGGSSSARAAVMANWFTLPVEATEAMIGRTSAGTPLRSLLNEVAPGARRSAEDVLRSGIARGQNPRVVARELARVTSTSYTRLTTITRTEMLGAQREAARLTMAANPQVIAGWTWTAALGDGRTCLSCIAMNGTLHPVSETLDDHPRGRCAAAPRTRSWSELGYPDGRDLPMPQTGPEWFRGLTRADQDAIAGPAKAEALRSGEIAFEDLVARRVSPVWGPMRREASLREAKASALAR